MEQLERLSTENIHKIISIKQTYSSSLRRFTMSLYYRFHFITDKIVPSIGFAVSYNKIDWKNTEENTSGDFNLIFPAIGFQVEVLPFEFESPFPIRAGISFGMINAYIPSSYEIDENGVETLKNWNNKFFPIMTFLIRIPKN